MVSRSKILCGISRAIQVMSFQHMVMSIKNARFKPQPSIPMQSFVTMRFTLFQLVSIDLIGIIPFMEIDDKGGEVGTKI
jgi:hypothetical protein